MGVEGSKKIRMEGAEPDTGRWVEEMGEDKGV